jgi:hypothetical protein
MAGFDHAGDMLLVYLPQEHILAESDAILIGDELPVAVARSGDTLPCQRPRRPTVQ